MKGKLFYAPLENPKRVLDIGTGTGIWAMEFGSFRVSTMITISMTDFPTKPIIFHKRVSVTDDSHIRRCSQLRSRV